jgi:thymidylate synthase (FAD)
MKVTLLNITQDAEKLIERCGRISHKSEEKITKTSYKNFIKLLIKLGHESVFEHASATFLIEDVPRALTHEIVRHRLCSFTQKSQRYVDESSLKFYTPDEIKNNNLALIEYEEIQEQTRQSYIRLLELGIKKEDARCVLNNAVASDIIITANMRQWRHMMKIRLDKSAWLPYRKMMSMILYFLKEYSPTLFEEFTMEKLVVDIDFIDKTIKEI